MSEFIIPKITYKNRIPKSMLESMWDAPENLTDEGLEMLDDDTLYLYQAANWINKQLILSDPEISRMRDSYLETLDEPMENPTEWLTYRQVSDTYGIRANGLAVRHKRNPWLTYMPYLVPMVYKWTESRAERIQLNGSVQAWEIHQWRAGVELGRLERARAQKREYMKTYNRKGEVSKRDRVKVPTDAPTRPKAPGVCGYVSCLEKVDPLSPVGLCTDHRQAAIRKVGIG